MSERKWPRIREREWGSSIWEYVEEKKEGWNVVIIL